MQITSDFSLKKYNTFSVDAKAKYFVIINDISELSELITSEIYKDNQHFVLGGGSNVLFKNDFDGIVIHMQNKGIEIVKKTENHAYIKSAGGVIWDDLVKFTVDNGYGGIENLSLIPGSVGASPVQNIGAYGTELKDVLEETEIYNLDTGEIDIFTNEMCKFGYRNSIFKNELKNKIIVLSVTLKLNIKPELNLNYRELQNRMSEIESPTINDVRNTVIDIRTKKLPDPEIIPNSGSFFKNPIISKDIFENLLSKFPNLISYPVDNANVKLAAGQLIDMCGWKSVQEGKVAVHPNQALVITNKKNASGNEIYEFSTKIQKSVLDKFGIEISPEVNIL
ncbi:MAG: UDP-N-acetylmuramate dehydrogenase [Saprospiraceae bacterium]